MPFFAFSGLSPSPKNRSFGWLSSVIALRICCPQIFNGFLLGSPGKCPHPLVVIPPSLRITMLPFSSPSMKPARRFCQVFRVSPRFWPAVPCAAILISTSKPLYNFLLIQHAETDPLFPGRLFANTNRPEEKPTRHFLNQLIPSFEESPEYP